jgi:hypothetical protein
MIGSWRAVDERTIVEALLAIHRGLREGDRNVISAGFDRLNAATNSAYWMWGSASVMWAEDPGDPSTMPLFLTNALTNEWLRLDPMTGTAQCGSPGESDRERSTRMRNLAMVN